jgi:tetratricopeptide (TPR) repeat protein
MTLRKLSWLPQDDRDTLGFIQDIFRQKQMRECAAALHDSVQPDGAYHDVKEAQIMYAEACLKVFPKGWGDMSPHERGKYRFERAERVAAHIETIDGALGCVRLNYLYAKSLSDMRQPDKARDCLQTLYRTPNRRKSFLKNSKAVTLLAYLLRRSSRPQEAIDLLKDALTLSNHNGKNEYLNFTMATTLTLTGHEDEARTFLQHQVGSREGVLRFHPEAHKLLESLSKPRKGDGSATRFGMN